MITPGVVGIARVSGRFSVPWLVAGTLLFVLNYLFPAIQRDLEQWLWQTSLSTRVDSVLSTYILDGALIWVGLTLSFCVSGGMYRLAFRELGAEPATMRDLTAGLPHFSEFVQLAFVAAVLEEILWAILSQSLPAVMAVVLRIVIVWATITPFIFTVPLMVDREMPSIKAMRGSYDIVRKEPLNAFLLLLAAGFWANIGFLVFFVGVIFTLPTYHRAIARAYRSTLDPRE